MVRAETKKKSFSHWLNQFDFYKNSDTILNMNSKSIITVTGAEVGNVVFELDEACAATRLTEDEHKFAVYAIIAAWKAQLSSKKVK